MGTGKLSHLEGEMKRIRRLVREAIDRGPKDGRDLNRLTLGFDLEDESKNVNYLVNDGDLVDLAQASLELHYKPGRNPSNDQPTAKLLYLALNRLQPTGPYWWSTPGLRETPEGAVVWDWRGDVVLWVRPGVDFPPSEPD
jgi:hypothetical protein